MEGEGRVQTEGDKETEYKKTQRMRKRKRSEGEGTCKVLGHHRLFLKTMTHYFLVPRAWFDLVLKVGKREERERGQKKQEQNVY